MAVSPDSGPVVRAGAGEAAAPGWVAVPVLLLVAAVAGSVLPGVLLASAGLFRPAVAGPAMGAGAALAAWAAWPAARRAGRPSGSAGAAAHLAAAAAVVGVGLFSVFHLQASGEWMLTDRDPGTAATASMWLADEGRFDAPAAPGAFSSVAWARGDTAQGWLADGDDVTPQFMHGTHVALAATRWIGGDAMFRLSPILALLGALCLFVLAGRWLPQWAAAGSAISLAALAPQAFVARGPFSEPMAQVLLIGGAALLLGAVDTGARRCLLVAGAVAGAAVLARVDGVLALAALGPWLAFRAAAARRDGRRPGREPRWVLLGLGLAGLVVVVDGLGPAGKYLGLHASEVASQVALVGGAWALSALWYATTGRHPSAAGPRWRAAAGPAVAALVVVVVAALWWVRPAVETTREAEPSPHVAALQAAEGLPIDPTRRYFEDSARWLSWYLGPVGFSLAALGLAAGSRRLVEGRDRDGRLLLVLGLAALPTAVFVWRVRTGPDHLWVMRRFVPATLPLLAASAWAAAAGTSAVVGRWLGPRAGGVAVPALVAAAVAVPIVAAYLPLHAMSLQAGVLDAVEDTCAWLGPDAAVLALADETAAIILPATLRVACRLPVVGATRPVSATELAALSTRWAGDGRRLFVVSDTPALLTGLLGDVPVQAFTARNDREPVEGLTGRPDRLRRQDWRWAIAPVRPVSAGGRAVRE